MSSSIFPSGVLNEIPIPGVEPLKNFAISAAVPVGVQCPLDVVEERERSRNDRTLGQARAQIDKVHTHLTYDLAVDTSLANPATCAAEIAAIVAKRERL